jgi:acyl homoserine lactone synthase
MHSREARMEILSGTPAQLAPCVVAGVARYRYHVFVERLRWTLSSCDGLEFDEFDRPDTLYLAARGANGAFMGTARLLPTHRPYLLGEVFPQLMGQVPVPRSPEVWELSRFAAVDLAAQPTGSDQPFSSPVAVALLEAALALAAGAGVQRLITVSPLGVERLLRRAGFLAHRAAPPRVVHGRALFACWIETGRGEWDASAPRRV